MREKAVVFDMDGVLFDTEALCMKGWSIIAGEERIEGMEQVSLQCIGLNANDTRALVLAHYGQDFPYEAFRQRVSAWVGNSLDRDGVPVKKGVRELLAFLKDAGYKIGLASSSRREVVVSHLTRTKLLPYFSVIVTGDMVEHSKPLPDIYLLACEQLQVNPRDAYAIEDSPNGIRSAHGAGMHPLMVPDLVPADEEMEHLSDHVFTDLLEVRDYLQQKDQSER